MRSAISYINCLQELLQDCEAGRVGEEMYRESILLDVKEKQKIDAEKSKKKSQVKNRETKTQKKKEKANKVSGKWRNYSEIFLEQKFGQPMKVPSCSNPHGHHNIQPVDPVSYECESPPPSSPKDVNEISLHISLLDTYTLAARDKDNIYYICTNSEI